VLLDADCECLLAGFVCMLDGFVLICVECEVLSGVCVYFCVDFVCL